MTSFSLTCMAGELARALSVASAVTDHGIKVPVLKATRIEVGDGSAQIAATNTDHAIRVTIAAEGAGIVHVDTATLAVKANALRGNLPVVITADESGKFVTIVQGKTRWRAPILLGDGFPVEFTRPVDGAPTEVGRAALFAALSIATINVIPDIVQAIGMGVFLDQGDGKFRVVSAQKAGLYVVELPPPCLPFDALLPLDSSRAMREIFKDADALTIRSNGGAMGGLMTVEADRILYKTKLVEKAYGNWRDARDKQSAGLGRKCYADKAELIAALDRATAIAEDKEKSAAYVGVRMSVADGELVFSAQNRNGEEGTDTLQVEGDDGVFSSSSGLLRDAINSIITERVCLEYSIDEQRPLIVRPEPAGEREDFRIVMPMRM